MQCWRAKTDGWAASTFHSNCDGKGPTVTIIKVGSYIFGGYTDISWSSPPPGKNPIIARAGSLRIVKGVVSHYCLLSPTTQRASLYK